ncbi:hypothetical protein ACSBR1_000491 [Camellia fascicularis]
MAMAVSARKSSRMPFVDFILGSPVLELARDFTLLMLTMMDLSPRMKWEFSLKMLSTLDLLSRRHSSSLVIKGSILLNRSCPKYMNFFNVFSHNPC